MGCEVHRTGGTQLLLRLGPDCAATMRDMVVMDTRSVELRRPDGAPVRILVVDDEATLTDLLSMALRYEGCEVRSAPGQTSFTVRLRGAESGHPATGQEAVSDLD